MRWRPTRDEQVSQCRQNILVFELPCDDERQTFPAGLVDDCQDAELAAVMRAPLDEVLGPHVPGILGPQPDARSVIEP